MDLRDACEQCGNVVGAMSLVFFSLSLRGSISFVSHVFFAVVVFLIVVMCSYDETLCGFWWVRVDSDRSL